MHKFFTLSSLIVASLIVVVVFVTATTYIQLAVAIALYPLLVFFVLKTFPRKNWRHSPKKLATVIQPPAESAEKAMPAGRQVEAARTESMGIADIDKRVFLKLIGGLGLSFFLFSIFNKKAEGLFYKSLPETGRSSLEDIAGNKIDPAQSQPMDGYRISEIDENLISFYGFTNKDGAWFIMREDTDMGSFRYAKGGSNFPGNWGNRENLNYDYFNNVF